MIKGGIRITLEKHIPVAAGMAGGSAECGSGALWYESGCIT